MITLLIPVATLSADALAAFSHLSVILRGSHFAKYIPNGEFPCIVSIVLPLSPSLISKLAKVKSRRWSFLLKLQKKGAVTFTLPLELPFAP